MTVKRYMDIKGLGEYIHLSKSTIYTMVNNKEIPFVKVRARLLFDTIVIDEWLKNGCRMNDELPKLPRL
jgi:excisionase family DNA binding protein